MFKQVRRKERELSHREAEEILLNGLYGVLSVNSDNGFAYGVPLGYVYMNGNIYFHWALEGHKLDCIRASNKVSFCVVENPQVLAEQFSMQYASVIVFGEVCEVDNSEKMAALLAFVEKYSSQFSEKGRECANNSQGQTVVIKLKIVHLTGKARK